MRTSVRIVRDRWSHWYILSGPCTLVRRKSPIPTGGTKHRILSLGDTGKTPAGGEYDPRCFINLQHVHITFFLA